MGKNNKKGPKANVFKVAGAKSLKKTKAKAVNLGLKNIKQKIQEVDAQFVEIDKSPRPTTGAKSIDKPKEKKEEKKKATQEDVAKATAEIVKMDL